MAGVFQVDREIFDNNIWQNPTEFRLFFYILGNAVWSEEGVWFGDIHVKRGQYLRSYRNLREDLVYTENGATKLYGTTTIKRVTDKLVDDGRLKKEETKFGTLFTVVNYSKYQWLGDVKCEDLEQADQRNTNGTPTEHPTRNTNGTPLSDYNDKVTKVEDKATWNTDGTPINGEVRNNNNKKNNNNKDNNKNPPLKKEQRTFDNDDKEYLLAEYLSKQIAKRLNKPLKEEKDIQRWAADFNKMVRLDNYDIEEIKQVLMFSQKNDFWQTNILSATKFRKQYLTLLSQMERDEGKGKPATEKKTNKFHNFIQSDMDGEDLEAMARKRFEKLIQGKKKEAEHED